MEPAQLRSLLKKQPFQPFRVYMNSGHSYDVPSPEWMMVMSLTSALGMPGKSGDGEIVMLLDNMNISHTEPLTMAKPA